MSNEVMFPLPWAADAPMLQPAGRAPHKIVVDGVYKAFRTEAGALEVVGGISFSVAAGQTLAIVGPSGCGKSTLLGILAGFSPPDRGGVLIDGVRRQRADRRGIVISQQGSVFPWLSVQENIAFGLDTGTRAERLEIVAHFVELVGLKGFERRYPHELSGGMLKRVELARAFAVKPEILYMDEPFSALDALMSLRMRNELLQLLRQHQQTLLLITHDVEEAIHLADRILVLTPRPATIKASIDVTLTHPRKLTSLEAQSLKERILRELGV
ncbi:MAG TPA: ABC transporter ATP-binding protein [Polyangiaceae bacterium]|nr:ABC transporter ATP-binding protein [Polyangiaceae bacterium]